MTHPITSGDPVVITDASGAEHHTTALSGPTRGRDMSIVWVEVPAGFPGRGERMPWPVPSVRHAADAGATTGEATA